MPSWEAHLGGCRRNGHGRLLPRGLGNGGDLTGTPPARKQRPGRCAQACLGMGLGNGSTTFFQPFVNLFTFTVSWSAIRTSGLFWPNQGPDGSVCRPGNGLPLRAGVWIAIRPTGPEGDAQRGFQAPGLRAPPTSRPRRPPSLVDFFGDGHMIRGRPTIRILTAPGPTRARNRREGDGQAPARRKAARSFRENASASTRCTEEDNDAIRYSRRGELLGRIRR